MSCRNETKTAIIPVDSMKLIMWDMMKADEWFNRKIIQDTNAIRNKEDVKLYEMVFKIHGVSRERYFASYRYYEGRPVSFKRLLDSLDALSNRERLKRYEIERGQPKK
nr:DUF4296 domain-containing protein [Sediminibacterium sp.]